MNKRLLFITSRLLWPIDGGRKMSLNYYCKGLHERFGYDIYLYSFPENGQSLNSKFPEYIKDVRIAKKISFYEQIINVIYYSLGKKKWPLQCSFFYSKENARVISDYCDEIKPDVIFTEMIRTATYIDAFRDKAIIKIANLDDLLSKRYIRQCTSKFSNANVAGAFSSKLPSFLSSLIRLNWVKKILLLYESKHCVKWEQEVYKEYNHVMFTSPIETNEMNKMMGENKAITLSVGIDYELFSRPIAELEKEKNSLAYVGNFKVATNCDTLKMICEDILPILKHEYKFYVIGLCPKEIIDLYSVNPNIIFSGRVEDLAVAVRKSEVFFCPIAYGTGIKTKIVEAMAMGMPVITNDIGAEGIAAENGKHFVVANEPEELVDQLERLFDNQEIRNEIGHNAQNFAHEYFRWDVIYEAFNLANL